MAESPVRPASDLRRGRLTATLTEWPFDCWRNPEPMGFSNSGLDCYWSSALVTMLHMPPLLQWLSSHEQSHCAAGVDTSECPACLLRFICKMYWSVDKKDSQEELDRLGTRLWKSCLKIFWREQTREQQDASLFLTTFIRYLIDEFDIPESDYQLFSHMFMSRIKYRNQCLNCDKVTYTDISEDLTLTALPPRRGSRTLIEGMRCSSIQETSDWLCEGCGVRTTVVRQSFIRDAPEVLLIQINRHAGISNRLATKLIYEENIDLTEFLEPYARQTGESLTYQIYGVICHEGSGTTGGHYTTFVRSPENGWAHINDANVTPATLENALGQNMSRFSGRYAMIPYTLIYLRMPMQSADTGTRLTIDDSLFNSSLNESTVVPIDRPKDIRERNKQSPVQLDSEGSDAELAASFEFIEPDEAPEIGNSPAIKPASAPAPPLVTRWEGQPAEITVKVTMGEMVLSGVLRGVLKRNYRRYASAAYKGSIPPEKPQGITKARTGVRSSSRGPSIKDDGPPEPAQSST